MHSHLFRLETFVNGQWVVVREGLSATLAAFGAALAGRENPNAPWRAVRDDGAIFRP